MLPQARARVLGWNLSSSPARISWEAGALRRKREPGWAQRCVGAGTMRSQGSAMRLAWSRRLLYSSSSQSRCRVLSGSLSCTGIDTFDRSLPMLLRSMFHRLTSAPGPLAAGRQRRRGGPGALPGTQPPGAHHSRVTLPASRHSKPSGWPTALLPPTPSPVSTLWGRAAGELILDELPGWAAGKLHSESLPQCPPLPSVPFIHTETNVGMQIIPPIL